MPMYMTPPLSRVGLERLFHPRGRMKPGTARRDPDTVRGA